MLILHFSRPQRILLLHIVHSLYHSPTKHLLRTSCVSGAMMGIKILLGQQHWVKNMNKPINNLLLNSTHKTLIMKKFPIEPLFTAWKGEFLTHCWGSRCPYSFLDDVFFPKANKEKEIIESRVARKMLGNLNSALGIRKLFSVMGWIVSLGFVSCSFGCNYSSLTL